MDRTSWSQAQRPPQVCAAWAHGRASSSVCAAGPAAACPRAGLTGEVEILVTCGDERGREGGLALVTPSETPASPSQGTNAYRWTDGRNVAVTDTLKPRPWPSPRWEVTLSQGPRHQVLASPFPRSLRTESLVIALLGTAHGGL